MVFFCHFRQKHFSNQLPAEFIYLEPTLEWIGVKKLNNKTGMFLVGGADPGNDLFLFWVGLQS